MSFMSHYRRWQNDEPAPGMRCNLGETRYGWLVRDTVSGEVFRCLSGFEKRTRVHRDGEDSVHLLSNSVEVEIISVTQPRYNFHAGMTVKILYPAKNAGQVGVIAAPNSRLTVVPLNQRGVEYLVDQDMAIPIKAHLVVDND